MNTMTNLRLARPSELSAADWQLWSNLQTQNPLLESPYFRPEFTQAVAAVRSDVEIGLIETGGQTVGFFPFQRGRLNIGKPVGGKLSDYHGLVAASDAEAQPRDVIRQCRLAGWDFDHLVAQSAFEPFVITREESPYLDLSQGYEAYCQGRRAAGSDVVAKTNQKARKCERENGAMTFEYDCGDDRLFQQLREWKSAQYKRTGLADVFAFPWTVRLLDHLRQNQNEGLSCPLSVLRVAGRPACIALSLRSRDVLHCWFIAYEPELAPYSPGQTFFLRWPKWLPAWAFGGSTWAKGTSVTNGASPRPESRFGKEPSAQNRCRCCCAAPGGKPATGSTTRPCERPPSCRRGSSSRSGSGQPITKRGRESFSAKYRPIGS